MIRDLEFKVIVQNKPNNMSFTNIYYPKLVSVSTSDEIPFNVSTAKIEVISNSPLGTDTYVSPFKEDDIIRLLVCETYGDTSNDYETHKSWTEIFSGRIRSMKNNYGDKNTTTLECVGHEEEFEWAPINDDFTFPSNTDALTIMVSGMLMGGRRIIKVLTSYAWYGITVPEYSFTKYQTSMSDVISDMEKTSGLKWYADVLPIYFPDDKLDSVYLVWRPLPNIPNNQYKCIEGTARFISSDFESSIEELLTFLSEMGQLLPLNLR